jgi:hypothetical protein
MLWFRFNPSFATRKNETGTLGQIFHVATDVSRSADSTKIKVGWDNRPGRQ